MNVDQRRLDRRRGDYGVDAPYVPLAFGAGGLLLAVVAVLAARAGSAGDAVGPAIGAVWLLLSAASYLYTTRRGKFVVWAGLLRSLDLRGDERLLDVGCGRGAVLLMAAQLLPAGEVVGVDRWRLGDQSGDSPEAARHNAVREGVADRVRIVTADVRALPFADAAFDAVVSSLTIHNIGSADGRATAIAEAVRVLRPGGRLLLADIRATGEYVASLSRLGMLDVERRGLGWRFWYGGPWVATALVSARKPG